MAAETPIMTLTMNERLTLAAAAAPVVAAVVVAEVVAMTQTRFGAESRAEENSQ